MKYEINKNENGIVTASVTVNSDEWQEHMQVAYEKNKGKYAVQGFRKGKAPRAVLEKNYGAHIFVQDAMDDVYYKSYGKIITENSDIKPIDSPKLDIKNFDEKKGLEFILEIPCMPEFELGQYKDKTFESHKHTVTDEMVDEQIKRELMRASKLVDTKEKSKMDDFVTLDFEGFIDGKAFEGGKSDDYQLKLGSHSFIDNFEEQLVGVDIGDEKEINVTFPADYHEKKYAGKPAMFKVKIKAIRSRVMPELNDEFVANSTEYETIDEYKTGLKSKLQERENEKAENELNAMILDSIIDGTNLTLPETLVNREVEYMLHEIEHQLQHQGITLDDYVKYLGKTIDDLKKEQLEIARKNLKGRFVLQQLIEKEKLNIKEGQFDEKLAYYAKLQNKTIEEFKKSVNEQIENQILNAILNDNVIKFLKDNNNIK